MDNQLELYKSIIDDAVDAIFVGDEKGNFIIVNKSAEQLTGYSKDELLSSNMSNLFLQKILKKTPLKYDSLDSYKVITTERELIKKDGTSVQIEMKSKKLKTGNYQSFIRDISERKQKEKELKDKDARYKALFELSPTGILIEDSNGKIIDANPAIHKNFGYDDKTLIGKNILALAHHEKHDEVKSNIKKLLNGESLNHTVLSIKEDGNEIYNELHETKFSLPELGDGILSISNDITKQVVAENKLKLNESNFKELFEYAPIPFLEEDVTELFEFYDELKKNGVNDIRKYLDENPSVLIECINKIKPNKINQAGLDLYELKNIEEYKNNFQTIFTEKSLEVFKEQIIAFSKGFKTFSEETETINPAGEKKHLLMKIQLRPPTESGTRTELFSLIDITQKKQAELALKKSKEQLQFAIDGSNIGLWDWNIKLGKTEFNEKWANIIGYSLDDLKPFYDSYWENYIHPDDIENSSQLINQHLIGKSISYECEVRMKHKTGKWIWTLIRGKVVEWDEDNKPIRMVGTHLDITERKKNNELIIKYSQEVEGLIHLSEEMISNLDVTEIINTIPKYIVQASNKAESASMWKYNKLKDNFEVVSWFGYGNRKMEGFTLPKSKTLLGEIFDSKKAIICNDTEKDPRYRKDLSDREIKTKATLGIPLLIENKPEYIIFADNFTKTDVFNHDDLKILQSFTNLATISITNAQSHKKSIVSEEKYRSIFDSSGESIFIHDLETGKVLDVNKNMLKTYGLTYEEALNANPNDSSSGVYPYTGEEVFKKVQKAKTEGPQLFEWHAKKKNGELFWTEVNLQKAKIANVERIVAVVRDITERKEIEKEIYYQASLLDSANDAIIASFDKKIEDKLNNKITFWNKGAEKLFGWTKNEVLGKNIRDILPLEIIDSDYSTVIKELNINGFWSGETIQYDKEGNKKHIILSISAIEENGKQIGVIGVNHDITEKKLVEEAIKESEAKIQSIMRGAPVGIGFVKNRILEYVNDHLLKLLGFTKEEMIGKNSKIFYESIEHYDKIGNLYNKLKTNVTASDETIIKNKSGRVIDVIITLSPIDKDDLTKGLVFSVLDITENKRNVAKIKLEQLRYKNLFENSPVPLWEEDFSEIYSKIEELKKEGVSDLREYFDSNEDSLSEFILLSKVTNVNQATLKLHNAKSKEELYGGLEKVFTENSINIFKEEMIAIFEKKKYFKGEAEVKTIDNITRIVEIHLYLDYENFENTKIFKALLATIDITERKNDERKKKELEVSYYDIFNNSSDAIYVQDKNGCFLDVNKGVFEMYGYSKDEMIGRTPEFVSADGKNDLEKISEFINEAFNNKPMQFEFWGKRKNGEVFPKLVRVKKGSYLGQDVVIAFALDITEQKKYEQELKRWADVFKHSKWGVVVGSGNKQELEIMNPTFAEMHGYTIEELVGKQADILLSPNDKSKLSGFRKEAHVKGQLSFESEHIRKDGSTFPTFSNVSAIKDIEGNVLHRIINVQDITELKEAEKIIKQERDQAQQYLDVAGVMLGVLDVNGTITLMNNKGLEILDYKEKELVGKNWFEIVLPKEYVNEVKKVFADTMSGKLKNVEYYENPIVTKNGDVKTIAFHNTVLRNYDSEIIGVLFSGEDITLQKEALENLKKSKEEMDELAQHLQDIREEERHGIAMEIHDDLGQTLTALKLDTSILLSKLPDADPSVIKKLVSMKDLTDQTIKTVQKISSELRPGILDDLGLSAALEWEIGKFEERTNIECKLQLNPSDISFDKKLNVTIFRLFQESCTNVARHSNATKLSIKIVQESNRVTMQIKDNGKGITKEQIINSKSFGIVGMRERLKNLQGSIIFTSKPNEGTTLDIKIPIKS